ncbi:MAG TPA: radical SAM protein [Solirubrobacterales bacterium]|nr:radical SAM protein [Solirubrobacterales bacterium]
MRILLLNPSPGALTIGLKRLAKMEPLALETLAAALPDHEVRIVDLELEPDLAGVLRSFRPELVGASAQIVQTYGARRALRLAKQHDPSTLTLVGGHHASLWPQDFDAPFVDAVVLGEGVAPLREIVSRAREGAIFAAKAGATGLEEVAGLALPGGGTLQRTRPRPIPATLDHQPIPDRGLTRRYRHRYFYLTESPVALVQTSMGCPYSCSFCSCQAFSSRRFVPRSPEAVVEELERIDSEFVMLADDHSFTNVERMRRLHDLIAARGIRKRYFAYSRVDTVVANPELFADWAKIGLEMVMTGLEALDDTTLGQLNKRIDAETSEQALAILERAGIGVSAGFVLLPDAREEDFRRIDDYVEAHPNVILAEFTPLTPMPGTGLYEEYRERLLTTNREAFDLAHFVVPTSLPQRQLYRLLRKYYGREVRRAARRMGVWRSRAALRRHVPRLALGAVRGWEEIGRAHRAISVAAPADA